MKATGKSRLDKVPALWTPQELEINADAQCSLRDQTSIRQEDRPLVYHVTIRLMKGGDQFTQDVVHKSDLSSAEWQLHNAQSDDEADAPKRVAIFP